MKIWFTEIGEPLPLEKDARPHRYGNLTSYLADRGHSVTWWTSNFSHAMKRAVCEGDRDFLENRVTLRVLEGKGYRRNVSLARFRHQADFAEKFFLRAKHYERPDIIVTPIPTIEAASRAVAFANAENIPVVVDIRDEWPDDFVRLVPGPLQWAGRIALHRYFQRMRQLCRDATGIIGTSERQLSHGLKYAGRVAGANDGVFPLGYPAHRSVDPEKLRAAHQWWVDLGVRSDAFVVCFFGTIGKFFDFETVIAAARQLASEFPIQFVVCGDGSALEKYRRLASDVPNVLFPGWVDEPKIAALMQLADAGLAPYAQSAESMSLPNKPFEYLSGGLPIISSITHGELRQLLDANQCGETYSSEDVEGLCAILRRWHRDPTRVATMGSNGRRLLEEKFATDRIFARLESHLQTLVGTPSDCVRMSTIREPASPVP